MMRGYSKFCPCLHCKAIRREQEEDAKPMYGKSIPLSVAALCPDCEKIVDRLDTCPDCGNRSLLGVAATLNRRVA